MSDLSLSRLTDLLADMPKRCSDVQRGALRVMRLKTASQDPPCRYRCVADIDALAKVLSEAGDICAEHKLPNRLHELRDKLNQFVNDAIQSIKARKEQADRLCDERDITRYSLLLGTVSEIDQLAKSLLQSVKRYVNLYAVPNVKAQRNKQAVANVGNRTLAEALGRNGEPQSNGQAVANNVALSIGKPKRKRGRREKPFSPEDERAVKAWMTHRYATYDDCARELGGDWTGKKLRKLAERQRGRERRKSASDN